MNVCENPVGELSMFIFSVFDPKGLKQGKKGLKHALNEQFSV
jgi:hypothetical protein